MRKTTIATAVAFLIASAIAQATTPLPATGGARDHGRVRESASSSQASSVPASFAHEARIRVAQATSSSESNSSRRISPTSSEQAPQANASRGEASQTRVAFNIPQGQSLGIALRTLVSQASTNVMFDESAVAGKKAPTLEMQGTLDEALERLLEGSGLEWRFLNPATVVVGPTGSLPKTSRTTSVASDAGPLRLAQNDQTQSDRTTGNASEEKESGEAAPANPDKDSAGSLAKPGHAVLSGRVTDGSSGTPLAGALVRVLETGRTASTDKLGNFRITGHAPRRYTVSVSYLGFAEKLWRVDVDEQGADIHEYPLEEAAWTEAEVTVFGNRSARSLALNQQRTADNNAEIISADLLGNFTGTTISESLRRVAGITFQRNPATGAGTNIMVRGLEPDMNAVKFNGLHLPAGNGNTRSASLDNILADSVSQITIHKTLLASHDSAGTGGLVEIETKSPLERPDRYVNFAMEAGRRDGDFGDNMLGSATVSRVFGSAQRFGVSASVQYSKADRSAFSYARNLQFGEYLPLSPAGTPVLGADDLDPRLPFPFEPAADGVYTDGGGIILTQSDSSTLAVSLSGEWQPTSIVSLKLDVQHSQSEDSYFSSNGDVALSSTYTTRGVAALGGQVRQALTYNGAAGLSQSYTLGEGQESITDTYSLRASATPGKWQINSTLGFAHGSRREPDSFYLGLGYDAGPQSPFGILLSPDDFLPEAVDPTEGIIISAYPRVGSKGMLLPLFTPATWDFFNDADNYFLSSASRTSSWGRNNRLTADANARYDLQWRRIEYLEGGINFETSRHASRSEGLLALPAVTVIPLPDSPFEYTVYPSLAPLGMRFEATDHLARLGSPGKGFRYLGEAGVREFFANLDANLLNPELFSGVFVNAPTDLERQRRTEERSLAAYLQGKLDFGKLELVPGLRLSSVQVNAVNASSPKIFDLFGFEDVAFSNANAKLLRESVTQTDLLPRVALNYRQSDNLVFRGGYFLTTARPQIGYLSNAEQIHLAQNPFSSPNGDRQTLTVFKGNPDLKPALTHNFDADVEYYSDDIGILRLGVFYKRIDNSLQANDYANFQDISSIALPDDPRFDGITAQNTHIVVTIPENSDEKAEIWGAELHVERQFTFLPGVLSGLGMYFNFGYTDSEAFQHWPWYAPTFDADGNIESYELRMLDFAGQRFNYQAATSGTAALTYNKRGVDATLAYGFQDRYQTGFTPGNLDEFAEGLGTLDLRIAYFFDRGGIKWRTFLEGTDLLKGVTDADLLNSFGGVGGSDKYYTSGSYLGGREIRLGVSATF